MTEGQRDLIRYKLQRASETLEEARIMYETDHLYGASNRIYYACFYAVTALLVTKDLSSSKHSGVVSLFNRHFVKPGLISVEVGKFYSRMFDNRLESDYGELVQIEPQDIKDQLAGAKDLIRTIEKLIDNL